MDEKQLEATVIHLIDRREATKKGSAECYAASEAIGKFIDKYPRRWLLRAKAQFKSGHRPL